MIPGRKLPYTESVLCIRPRYVKRNYILNLKGATKSMSETIKTASFEYLISLAKEKPEGGYDFTLDGAVYHLGDVLEISRIAEKHGYIVIY